MVIAVDPSTPSAVTTTTNANPTTNAFTPPAGSLVLVLLGVGWNSSGTASATCTDSGSHTWTSPVNATGAAGNGGLAQIFYSSFVTSPGSITVTGHITAAGSAGGGLLDVVVFAGAAQDQSSAGTAQLVTTTGTTGTMALTTTKAGSWAWGVSDDTSNLPATAWAPNGNTLVDVDYRDSTDNVNLVAWYGSGRFGTPGTYTMGGTWGASGKTNQCVMEVLPASDLVSPAVVLSQAVSRATLR